MKPSIKAIASQSSWVIRSDHVELAVTRQGGHMAPVTFCGGKKKTSRPYYVNPWCEEDLTIDDPRLAPDNPVENPSIGHYQALAAR